MSGWDRPLVTIAVEMAHWGRLVGRGLLAYAATHHGWEFSLTNVWQDIYGTCRKFAGRPLALVAVIDDAMAEKLRRLDLCAVNVSCRYTPPGVISVYSDPLAVGRAGAEHLLEKRLDHFVFIGKRLGRLTERRAEGFRQRVSEAGGECLVLTPGENGMPHDPREMMARMGEVLASLPKPMGVMTSEDQTARQTLLACLDVGLRVPWDVAILGVDNDPFQCAFLPVPLSSVRPGFDTVGYRAGEAISTCFRTGEMPPGPIEVPPFRVEQRLSTDALYVGEPTVQAAVRFIKEHCTEDIQVPDVAQAVALSRRALEQRFRRHVGNTILEQIHRERYRRAADLLATTEMSVLEVSLAVNVRDVNRFSAEFRRRFGLPPSEFRKQHCTVPLTRAWGFD